MINTKILEKAQGKIAGLENAGREYADLLADPRKGKLEKCLWTGLAIQTLREILDQETMNLFMPLYRSPLGFFADKPDTKNPAPYSWEEVREVLIAALLQGVYPWGREFGIIRANLFIAKEGWRRKVREIPGVTEARVIPGRVMTSETEKEKRTYCQIFGTWKLNDKVFQLSNSEGKPGRTFDIPAGDTTGIDAVIGKAERRAWKAIWEEITQSRLLDEGDGEWELGEAPALPPQTLGRQANTPPALPAPDQAGTAQSKKLADDLLAKSSRKAQPATQPALNDDF